MTAYVLHFEPPFRHARHYIGFTPDASAERRVAEHLSAGPKGSPLVKAAIGAGCVVTLAHTFTGPDTGRALEAWLKARRDVRRWCPCCGVGGRPFPDPSRISPRFRARKEYP